MHPNAVGHSCRKTRPRGSRRAVPCRRTFLSQDTPTRLDETCCRTIASQDTPTELEETCRRTFLSQDTPTRLGELRGPTFLSQDTPTRLETSRRTFLSQDTKRTLNDPWRSAAIAAAGRPTESEHLTDCGRHLSMRYHSRTERNNRSWRVLLGTSIFLRLPPPPSFIYSVDDAHPLRRTATQNPTIRRVADPNHCPTSLDPPPQFQSFPSSFAS